MSETFKPSNIRRARNHGFLARTATSGGQNILKNRRRKGRKNLTVKTSR